jgi:hypothetical protein
MGEGFLGRLTVGAAVGATEGPREGDTEGRTLGRVVGNTEGVTEGATEGGTLGPVVGRLVGPWGGGLGSIPESCLGEGLRGFTCVGVLEGAAVGTTCVDRGRGSGSKRG